MTLQPRFVSQCHLRRLRQLGREEGLEVIYTHVSRREYTLCCKAYDASAAMAEWKESYSGCVTVRQVFISKQHQIKHNAAATGKLQCT